MTELDRLRSMLEEMLANGRKMTDPEVVAVSQELDGLVNAEMGASRVPLVSLRYLLPSLLVYPDNETVVREILDELESDCLLVSEGEARRKQLVDRLRGIGEVRVYEKLTLMELASLIGER